MSVADDFQVSAHLALQYYWGRVYTSLLESTDYKSWYIDDRAEPDMFWKLLSVANPELYKTMRDKKTIPKTYLPEAIKFLLKDDVKEVVEHQLKFVSE
jgi:hypothetical protein